MSSTGAAPSLRPTACSSPSATRRRPTLFGGQLEMKPSGYIRTAPGSTATAVPGRVRRRRRHRRGLPPGGHRRRHGLHGGAGGRTVSRRARRAARRRRVTTHTEAEGSRLQRRAGQCCANGQTWTGTSSGSSTPSPRRAASPMPARALGLSPVGGVAADQRARGGAVGAAVPPPCARPDPDRAGRAPLSHRARSVHEARVGARQLTDSRERPNGDLRVTTTVGIGSHWLTPRLGEFSDLYPDIRLTLILDRRASSTSPCARPTWRSACASRSSPT